MTSLLRKVPCFTGVLLMAFVPFGPEAKMPATGASLPTQRLDSQRLKTHLLVAVSRRCPGFADGFESRGPVWYETSGGYCVGVHGHTDPLDTQEHEQAQHDGETAEFVTEALSGVASYTNLYPEDDAFITVETVVPLGSTGGFDNPRQINHMFDDRRIPHT